MVCAEISLGQFSYFGKNKVQTRDYQFQCFETEHFKVFFYSGGEGIAEFAAKAAEDYYSTLKKDLNMELEDKVPIIIYLSPGQFRETNVITDLIEEGVGGFSELLKNRIVVPFNGSYKDLYQVIGHELTHIFEFRMFYRSRLAVLLGAVGEFQVPLWVLEGFSEFQSGWANVSSEIFMRDLVINNRLVSLVELNDNYGYLAYREGESFFRYVAEVYGREKVYEFMNTLKSRRNLEATFSAVFGMSQKKIGVEWENWLKMRYWPQIRKLNNFKEVAECLTNHNEDGSVYNTASALSPSGTKIAMVSDRTEYVDCYIISATDGRVLKKVVRGERSGGFEDMHLIRPGLAWSPDERLIAIVTTTANRDNIALIDVQRGKVKRRIFGNLDAIYSPKFSPDGKRLIFIGVKNGFSDIYTVAVEGGEPRRLTYDMYEERDPAFSPGGDTIVFVSDRPDPGEEWMPGDYAVWLLLPTGESERLTERRGFFGYPVWVHSEEFLLWVAQDSFSHNIFLYSLKDRRVVSRTDFLGEVSHLSLSRDDKKLAFSYFSNTGWDIAIMYEPLKKIPHGDTADGGRLTADGGRKFIKSGLDFEKVRPVGFSLSLDYLAGAASYTTGPEGFAGTLLIGFSDILGNHRFELYTDLYGDILNSNFLFQYWLLPYRIDYGFALFQFFDVPYYAPGLIYVERVTRGAQMIMSYPFDKFMRVEAGLSGMGSEIGVWGYEEYWMLDTLFWERTFFGSGAFVFDNTFWPDPLGPVRGTRLRFETGSSFLSTRQWKMLSGDLRNYQRLGRRFVFGTRLVNLAQLGEVGGYYIGGPIEVVRLNESYVSEYLEVRGYRLGEFYYDRGVSAGLFNLELRYPFIDRLKLAFPLPLDIRNIRGVAFLDGAVVFRDNMRLWDGQRLQDLKLGAGFGVRMLLLSYFYLKLDFAKPLSETKDKSLKVIFELGYDF
ncbi:MAG: hypothetical protein ABIK39_01420 [candidate division WOR-3 bacterium]